MKDRLYLNFRRTVHRGSEQSIDADFGNCLSGKVERVGAYENLLIVSVCLSGYCCVV